MTPPIQPDQPAAGIVDPHPDRTGTFRVVNTAIAQDDGATEYALLEHFTLEQGGPLDVSRGSLHLAADQIEKIKAQLRTVVLATLQDSLRVNLARALRGVPGEATALVAREADALARNATQALVVLIDDVIDQVVTEAPTS